MSLFSIGVQAPRTSRVMICVLVMALLSCAMANVYAEEGVQESHLVAAEAAHADYSENWWHGVRFDTWVWEGADPVVLTKTLERIASAKGKRRYPDLLDTIIKYGSGNWTYEFSVSGDEAYKKAIESEERGDAIASRRYFLEASYYYTHGSYPHTREKHSRAALAKAFEAYAQAGRFFRAPLEIWEFEVDGARFKAMVHWPVMAASSPVPVVLKTSGLDLLSTGFFPTSESLNDLGVAMIGFDIPGTGNDGILDENIDKHHVAVLDRVLQDSRFDKDRIAVWSESVGGWTGARMAFNHGEHLAASVDGCGLVHDIYTLGLVVPGPEGDKVRALLGAYRNGELSQQEIDAFNRKASQLPHLKNQGRNFQAVAFLDRIRLKEGELLQTLSMMLPMSLLEQGYLGEHKKNAYDTPLLVINTSNDPIVPRAESVLVAEASTQGKLMLFDDHDGHCVADSIGNPVTIKWLSYHMRLNKS